MVSYLDFAELFQKYRDNGYKVIEVVGYSPLNKAEGDDRYKKGKIPKIKQWNTKPSIEMEEGWNWINSGGWISLVVPDGLIFLDIDNHELLHDGKKTKSIKNEFTYPHKIAQVESVGRELNFGTHVSNNGKHYIFKTDKPYPASTKVFLKCGLAATYRTGGMSQIIIAPSLDRTWEKFVPTSDLAMLPEALKPLDLHSIDDVSRALASQLRYWFYNDVLQGNDHLDMPFIGMLVIDLKYDFNKVEKFLKMVYREDYDAEKTKLNFNKCFKAKAITKAGTFFQILRDATLYDTIELANKLIQLERVNNPAEVNGFESRISAEKINSHASRYAEQNKIVSFYGDIYQYNDGIYEHKTVEKIRSDFAAWLTDTHYTSKRVNEMLSYIKDKCHRELNTNSDLLLLKDNKVLNLKTLQLRDLTGEDHFLNKLNVSYDENAKCPRFEKFISEILSDRQEYVEYIQEFMGYSFTTETKHEKALVFAGEGCNGKSVLCAIWEYIIGEKNTSHLKMQDFVKEFFLEGLQNKLLQVCLELKTNYMSADDLLKSIISGETIKANRKFETPVEFRPYAKLIFNTNNSLITRDRSFGFERRLSIINFKEDFSERKDETLIDKLKAEANGIFMWALAGLKRLEARGKLSVPAAITKETQAELKLSDSVHSFLSDYVFWSPFEMETVTTNEIYSEFVKYCLMSGHQVLSMISFSKQLRRNVKDIEKVEMRGRHRGFKNMKYRAVPFDVRSKEFNQELLEDFGDKYIPVTKMLFDEYMKLQGGTIF